MSEKPYAEMSLGELIAASQPYDSNDLRYASFRAEFERRQTIAIVESATAQVRSSRWQLGAMIAMFLTAIATALVPWLLH